MSAVARDRLRTENDLREAEVLVGRLRGLSVDDAAQALKDHADLMRVPVVDVARAVISGRAGMIPIRPVSRPHPFDPADQPTSWAIGAATPPPRGRVRVEASEQRRSDRWAMVGCGSCGPDRLRAASRAPVVVRTRRRLDENPRLSGPAPFVATVETGPLTGGDPPPTCTDKCRQLRALTRGPTPTVRALNLQPRPGRGWFPRGYQAANGRTITAPGDATSLPLGPRRNAESLGDVARSWLLAHAGPALGVLPRCGLGRAGWLGLGQGPIAGRAFPRRRLGRRWSGVGGCFWRGCAAG